MIEFTLPIRVVNGSNESGRVHWRVICKRAREQRHLARITLGSVSSFNSDIPSPPWIVTLTRVGKRMMDDGNLGISFKHVQDGIADALGEDDGDRNKFRKWQYEQEIGKAYAVRVRIEAAK